MKSSRRKSGEGEAGAEGVRRKTKMDRPKRRRGGDGGTISAANEEEEEWRE